jgi:hypothetical protein
VLLSPGGALLVNLIGVAHGEGECRLWSVVRTVAAAFPATRLYVHAGRDFPERQNFLLAASADPAHAFPPRAGHFDTWPEDQWPALPCAVVLRDIEGRTEAAATPSGARGGRTARVEAPAD